MGRIKRFLVIIDTNKLGSYSKGSLQCKNYKYLEINKHLHESLVNNFNFKIVKDVSIDVAIPEIVLEELKQQQKEAFNSDLEKLKVLFEKFKELEKSELTPPTLDYKDFLTQKEGGYLGIYNLIKIARPSKEIFDKLVEKVVEKRKPFYKKNNQIDSGFKDALIWESILSFCSTNKYDEYFFLTEDSDFKDSFLMEEFREIVKRELNIITEIADLKGRLEEEIKGTKIINQTLEKIEETLLNQLLNFIYSNYVEVSHLGRFYDVEELVEYQVLDINISSEKFILSLLVYLEHESEYSLLAKQGILDENLAFDKAISSAEIKVTLDKDYKIKEISSEDLLINGDFKYSA